MAGRPVLRWLCALGFILLALSASMLVMGLAVALITTFEIPKVALTQSRVSERTRWSSGPSDVAGSPTAMLPPVAQPPSEQAEPEQRPMLPEGDDRSGPRTEVPAQPREASPTPETQESEPAGSVAAVAPLTALTGTQEGGEPPAEPPTSSADPLASNHSAELPGPPPLPATATPPAPAAAAGRTEPARKGHPSTRHAAKTVAHRAVRRSGLRPAPWPANSGFFGPPTATFGPGPSIR
jgi:hypothetical protein